MTFETLRSNLSPPLDRNPPAERLGSQEERRRSKDRKRAEKVVRLEAHGESRKTGNEWRKSQDRKHTEKVERLEAVRMRIYWKADPPESGEGGSKRTASRWYRTRHPDRVLPKEAVVP